MAQTKTYLQIVQQVFRKLNRKAPDSLANPNQYTQMIMDNVNDVIDMVNDIAITEGWPTAYGSGTFATVIGQRAYQLDATDIDTGATLRRIFIADVASQRDLTEATDAAWNARTLTTVTNTPEVYKRFGSSVVSGANVMDLQVDPVPSAVETWTYEYKTAFPNLSVDGDISLLPSSMLVWGAAAEVLEHKGKATQRADFKFQTLLQNERNKQSSSKQQLIYGSRTQTVDGINLDKSFSIIIE